MAPVRGRKVSIGFMVLWLIVWGAAILIAIWALGGAAWSGDLAAAAFLAVWLAAAAFGLANGIRRLVGLATGEPVRKRRLRPNRWNDGMEPTDGPPAPVPPPAPPPDRG